MDFIFVEGRPYTHREIYNNRLAVIAWLKKPSLRKAQGALRRGQGRCCLGHMCDAAGINPTKIDKVFNMSSGTHMYEGGDAFLPARVTIALGMYDYEGTIGSALDLDRYEAFKKKAYINRDATEGNNPDSIVRALSEWNDRTRVQPHQIGEYLETKILGGKMSPWKRIKRPTNV